MLEGPLPAWDVERRRAGVDAIVEYVHGELGSRAKPLDQLHRRLSAEQALAFAQHLTVMSRKRNAREAIHRALFDALPEVPWDSLAVQATAHFRILLPGDAMSPVPLHTDRGIGHALDERNVWMALTAAQKTSALHVLSLQESIPLDEERARSGDLLIRSGNAKPVDVASGEVLLFTPLHVHGARIVEEPTTRVSIDVRIAPRASAFARAPTAWVKPC